MWQEPLSVYSVTFYQHFFVCCWWQKWISICHCHFSWNKEYLIGHVDCLIEFKSLIIVITNHLSPSPFWLILLILARFPLPSNKLQVPPHELLDITATKSKAELATRGSLANRQLPSGTKKGSLSNSSSDYGLDESYNSADELTDNSSAYSPKPRQPPTSNNDHVAASNAGTRPTTLSTNPHYIIQPVGGVIYGRNHNRNTLWHVLATF